MNVNRRSFLLGSAVAARIGYGQTAQTVNTASIGVGNRGSYLLKAVLAQPNAKVAALCDIKPDRLDRAASSAARDNPATYADWRRVIDRKDVEAVFIATPLAPVPSRDFPQTLGTMVISAPVLAQRSIGHSLLLCRSICPLLLQQFRNPHSHLESPLRSQGSHHGDLP